jgi:hypothetical protein
MEANVPNKPDKYAKAKDFFYEQRMKNIWPGGRKSREIERISSGIGHAFSPRSAETSAGVSLFGTMAQFLAMPPLINRRRSMSLHLTRHLCRPCTRIVGNVSHISPLLSEEITSTARREKVSIRGMTATKALIPTLLLGKQSLEDGMLMVVNVFL